MKELRQKLKIYGTLNNEDRLNILIALYNNPGISFNDLARSVKIDKPLLAYHVGLLRHVGLVESRYERSGRKTTKYRLTDQALKVLEELKVIEKIKLPRTVA
ncbi:MAG: winged helix-turn-helix transcriptional regulator [Candidatus Freyrarchaeum guaymaensis]|nr:winged helix-turn-helix transcriptional regulator [Deltaproteobacteria bacterium]